MSELERIQNAIVEERNNFGDYSVCGDDLALAAAAAILVLKAASPGQYAALVVEAEHYRRTLRDACPGLGL